MSVANKIGNGKDLVASAKTPAPHNAGRQSPAAIEFSPNNCGKPLHSRSCLEIALRFQGIRPPRQRRKIVNLSQPDSPIIINGRLAVIGLGLDTASFAGYTCAGTSGQARKPKNASMRPMPLGRENPRTGDFPLNSRSSWCPWCRCGCSLRTRTAPPRYARKSSPMSRLLPT